MSTVWDCSVCGWTAQLHVRVVFFSFLLRAIRYVKCRWRIELKYIYFSDSSPFAALLTEYISGKLPESCSQLRLHFRLHSGSWVEKALLIPLRDIWVWLAFISFVILFQTSQSHRKLYPVLTQLRLSFYHLLGAPLVMIMIVLSADSLLLWLAIWHHGMQTKSEGFSWSMPWKCRDKGYHCLPSIADQFLTYWGACNSWGTVR